MDVTVTPAGSAKWEMTDLLGRSMGNIMFTDGAVTIHPDGQATKTMGTMKRGPFASLDQALEEIEIHTRGVCRLAPPQADRLRPTDIDER